MSKTTQLKVIDLLREHCHLGDDGFAHYDAPWSDQLVVEQFSSGELTLNHVKDWRVDIIGKLRLAYGGMASDKSGWLPAIEARLAQLEAWAAERPVKPFKAGDGSAPTLQMVTPIKRGVDLV